MTSRPRRLVRQLAVVCAVMGAGAFVATPAAATPRLPMPIVPIGDTLTVDAPASAVAGTSVSVTVTAKLLGSTDTSYNGTVHITSTDGAATLPGDTTLVSGVATVQVTFATAGNQTVTATDTTVPLTTGTSGNVAVTLPATHFVVDAPASSTAGTPVDVTVTAKDSGEGTVTGYPGTVHLTSSDATATLAADATLTNGTGTFSVTFKSAGTKTVTATDTTTPSITGSDSSTVSPGATTKLKVELPPTATAGHSVDFDVTAVDDYGNTTPSYVDFVHFSSGDPDATLPANGPLTDGSGTFPVTFKTAGNQGVIATDTVTPSITGSDGGVISADAATHLVVDAPPTATGGQPFNVSVTATDAYGNTDKAYSGTVHLSSSDGAAVLPADSTLTNGTKTFGVTLTTTGNQTVTATDAETASITGTSGSVTVSKIETTTTAGSTPTSLTATVTSGAGTPTGSVTFTVNGTQVGSPVALSSGVATVAYTLGTGTQTITATYGGSASFTGSSDQSVVTPPIVTAALSSAHPATPYGWYRDAVHITFSCQEGSAPVTCPSAVTVGTQGKAQSVSRTAVASDGGRASVTAVLSIDKHQPSLRLKGLKPGHTYRHAPHPKCKAKDSLSGIASCTIATHQHGKTVTVIATALDKAGNDSRLKAQYDLAKGTKA